MQILAAGKRQKLHHIQILDLCKLFFEPITWDLRPKILTFWHTP